MATAVQKITLASSRDIPFNKLVLSQSNVRRVKAGISVEELAESIARRGLIQSLHVRPVVDAEGKETGMFEVPAGGRRFRALELLVKQRRLAKVAPVPCVVSEASADVLIDEVSLAENIERAPLHPLDQFRAFQAMREKGMTEEAIAAAFFVDAKVVRQRLRLVSVSPALLDLYGIKNPTLNDKVGVFDDPKLQNLYDDLIEKGMLSLQDALEVGVLVEKTDIADLKEILAGNEPAEVDRVLTQLLKASYNHLAAFERQLR